VGNVSKMQAFAAVHVEGMFAYLCLLQAGGLYKGTCYDCRHGL
jgi:hypothetical protein